MKCHKFSRNRVLIPITPGYYILFSPESFSSNEFNLSTLVLVFISYWSKEKSTSAKFFFNYKTKQFSYSNRLHIALLHNSRAPRARFETRIL